jgi:hypothetical protein
LVQAGLQVCHTSPMAQPLLPNPAAGEAESLWYAENLPHMVAFQDKWVAILGQEIVMSGLSFEQVYGHLNQHQIGNALIVKVPPDVNAIPTLMA